MRLRQWSVALASLVLVVTSCSQGDITGPSNNASIRAEVGATLPAIRVSEFHYDNVGTDVGEAIEISGPAGTDLTNWKLVLYNGNTSSRIPYNTTTLTGSIPATCGTRGVVVTNYPSNGIQNGSGTATGIDPDGIALVDPLGNVVDRFAYEGSFTAAAAPAGGPAAGLTFDDIGVRETGVTSENGTSIQRNGAGVWSLTATTFGACNDQDVVVGEVNSVTVAPLTAAVTVGSTTQFTASAFDAANQPVPGATFTWTSSDESIATVDASGLAKGIASGTVTITATSNSKPGTASLQVNDPIPPVTGDVRFNEIHYDNAGTDVGEAIEIEGPAGLILDGWSIVLYNGNGGVVYNTKALTGTIPTLCSDRGVVSFSYPQDGLQNGSPDGMALVDPGNNVIQFISYEGQLTATDGPASGMTATDIDVSESTSSTIGKSLQRDAATGVWYGPATSSFGACNPPAPPPTISFTGRLVSDPALPVGFQDQLFASLKDAGGHDVTTTFTWSSDTPGIATIDQNGVFTSVSEGTAILRATAADGVTTNTLSLPMIVGSFSSVPQYGNNAEFGEPADADASDDFLIRRLQYTASYNTTKNIPNWVSYDLDASQIGSQDRCDCFTFDPLVPGDAYHYDTNDYTGSALINGFSIDRGHLARSFDRTTGTLDNAGTFYFSNIIPQASHLNQVTWAGMETYLGDLARFSNKEVYIIAGGAGSRGTLKNLGHITIPSTVWKVAVIMPRDQGLANVTSLADLDVIAVIMPNEETVDNDWTKYKTTVDAVEALSGYDMLALLPDQIEIAVESNTKPPVAAVDGPYTSAEGSAVSMSAAGSSDPDGDALTYAWDFGDGTTAVGVAQSHVYAQDGSYTVTMTATDIRGLINTVTTTATVSNVAPSIGAFAGATLFPGETYNASGSFTDPGSDAWTATVNYGTGAGPQNLALSGMNFTLSNKYSAAGTFTVTVAVSDDDVTSTATQTVIVQTALQGLQDATNQVNTLISSGKLTSQDAKQLLLYLQNAMTKIQVNDGKDKDKVPSELRNFLRELDSLVGQGKLSAADAAPLSDLVNRVLTSVSL